MKKRGSGFGVRDSGSVISNVKSQIVVKTSDHCATPDWLYKALDAEFHFDLDPCPLFGHEAQDGLAVNWDGKRVFCNPPYSKIKPWVEKALRSRALTVFLLPQRFDAAWGHLLWDSGAEIRIYRRGIKFELKAGRQASPFAGSMVVIVRRFDLLSP
jgi:hypothetical protein